MITSQHIEETYRSIKNQIEKTPLVYSPELSKRSGANVYLKMEHQQRTGSFKLRGALNKIKSLDSSEYKRTFVAASTGNHAAAFAHVCSEKKLKAVLFLPNDASPAKVKAIEHFDIDIRYHGENSMETEVKAADFAKEIGGVLIHPYNDIEIIKGQGTLGIEIKDQLPEVEVVMAPVGGGGLISGLASYFGDNEKVEVIGCQPENAAELYHSLKEGYIVEPSTLKTISDATAGGLEEYSITINICNKYLSGMELCSEEEIKKAIVFLIKYHQTLVEPGAALAVAYLLNTKKYAGKNVVAVLTGKKINMKLLNEILSDYGNDY
ncbi:MAG: pyridoxal-phosphate dependent enzyme [Balneolaceae bacterium]|nr:pyridoxal-phosphate dependent enzyme [Balneolaceae bacterium]MBO6547796.1 pyridoxal-phosphate dependent enzyme [Balneolaceae bacterium]MBO6648307.1 pyridoxal-phosphate dependent enzyme [Balneolaceae bacterium]